MAGGVWIRAYIAKCPLGAFAIDEAGKVIKFRAFEGPVEDAARMFSDITEEIILAKNLRQEGYDVISESKLPVEGVEHASPNPGGEALRRRMAEMAIEVALFETRGEANERARLVSMALARTSLQDSGAPLEIRLITQIRLLDEIQASVERFTRRLKESCIATDPSSGGMESDDPDTLLAEISSRTGVIEAGLCKTVRELLETRKELEKSVEETAVKIMPNLTGVAGPLVAAKLVAEAGGIRQLALMSATKIQILGARTAVFRYMHGGGKPPKHGVIFHHPLVGGSKWWQRGKIAKALASVITIAVRADAFGERIAGETLRKRFEDEVSAIKADRIEPPAGNRKKGGPRKKHGKGKKKR
jgi:nucleolar protein 56